MTQTPPVGALIGEKISPTDGAVDIHKAIGKLPKPARGWSLVYGQMSDHLAV